MKRVVDPKRGKKTSWPLILPYSLAFSDRHCEMKVFLQTSVADLTKKHIACLLIHDALREQVLRDTRTPIVGLQVEFMIVSPQHLLVYGCVQN